MSTLQQNARLWFNESKSVVTVQGRFCLEHRIPTPKWTAGAPCSAEGLQECQMKHLRYLHAVNETEFEAGYDTFC
ncbi:hypothetical protein AVEN_142986-1, partial [Araneus ventricosus]